MDYSNLDLTNRGPWVRYTYYNSKFGLDFNGVDQLAIAATNPQIQDIFLGELTKWVSSLIYYPFNINRWNTTGHADKLVIGGVKRDIDCYKLDEDVLTWGFNLGQYHYEPIYNDFRDYEPYTKLQLYLPFYGTLDVPIADVLGKWIQIFLKVDFDTGQATYLIGVNDRMVVRPDEPIFLKMNIATNQDVNTRIITSVNFMIGKHLPIGTTGASDMLRNILIGGVRAISSIAGGYYNASLPPSTTTASASTNYTIKTRGRNYLTGRMVNTGEQTMAGENSKTITYDRSQHIPSSFDTALDVLQTAHLNASTTPSNDPMFGVGPYSVLVIRRTVKMLDVETDYNELYGKPLGEVRRLQDVHGYTEVSAIHFEGSGFSSATNVEMAMIEQEFNSGVILP